jgi:hypothetical protein
MKKLSFAIILTVTTISFTEAQNAEVNFAKNEKKANMGITEQPEFQSRPAAMNEVNIKSLKDFSRSCRNPENVHWFVSSSGSCVYYSENGKNGKRVYDKKGSFIYDMLSYSEEHLPFAIRDRVKQIYYLDYNITQVQEIQTERKIIYLVQIQDKTTWKQVRICDDEMDVVDEFKIKQ